jgi:hypothetical protein
VLPSTIIFNPKFGKFGLKLGSLSFKNLDATLEKVLIPVKMKITNIRNLGFFRRKIKVLKEIWNKDKE